MNTKTKIFALSTIIIFMVGIICPSFVQANSKTIFHGVEENNRAWFSTHIGYTFPNEYGDYLAYSIKQPQSDLGVTGSTIWNIKMGTINEASSHKEGNIFCLKEGLGFTGNIAGLGGGRIQEYKKFSYLRENIQSDNVKALKASELIKHPDMLSVEMLNLANKSLNLTEEFKKDGITIEGTDTSNINRYDAIMALVDLMYLDEEYNNKAIILDPKARENRKNYLVNCGVNVTDSEDPVEDSVLDMNEIKSIEQAAIWLFTNYKLEEGEGKDFYLLSEKDQDVQNGRAFWLTYLKVNNKIDDESYYNSEQKTSLKNYRTDKGNVGDAKAIQAHELYKYYVTTAIKNAGKNNEASKVDGYIDSNPIRSENGVYTIKVKDKLTLPVSFKIDSYPKGKIIDANGNQPIDEKEFLKRLNTNQKVEFKIKNEQEIIGDIKFGFSWDIREATLWQGAGTEKDKQQPLLIPQKIPKNQDISIKPYKEERKFDLALRKYITHINGNEIEASYARKPEISYASLNDVKNGTTTATYKHRKDPVQVEKGDIVTYNLEIYNEGQVAGRATQIVDQLPEGLEFDSVVSGDFEVKEDRDNRDNRVTLVRKADNKADNKAYLNPYDGKNLASETITIQCKVTREPEFVRRGENGTENRPEKVLTNVAWISKHEDKDGKEVTDRDSKPEDSPKVDKNDENIENYKGNKENNGKELSNNDEYFKGQEDDDDFEKLTLLPKEFDLKLVKSIVGVNKGPEDPEIKPSRVKEGADVDTSSLNKEGNTTAGYEKEPKEKNPVLVKKGDIVKYKLRVYNEGMIDGYATEITENIPKGLQFLWKDNAKTEEEKKAAGWNAKYLWEVFKPDEPDAWDKDMNPTKVRTSYLNNKDKDNEIKAFGKNDGNTKMKPENYKDVYIWLKVVADDLSGNTIRNEAAITNDQDKDGNDVTDRDSDPKHWIKYEDDEDFDIIKLQSFDLALRKFIIGVSKDDKFDMEKDADYSRAPKVDTSKLNSGEGNDRQTTAIYEHPKEPVKVNIGDYVIYNFRIYNEGEIDGYATEIRDILPEYLDYVDCEFNKVRGWKKDDKNPRKVSTDYLKKEKIAAAIKTEEGYDLKSKDVQIMCKVNENAITNQNITNIADITEFKDEDGNDIKDRDSQEGNVKVPEAEKLPEYKDEEKGKYVPGQQDDDDFEKVVVKKFDLALRKYITHVNGKELTDKRKPIIEYESLNKGTATYKHRKDPVLVKTGDIVTYNLTIYNEGQKKGRATKVVDQLPTGLEFDKVVSGKFEVKEDGYNKETNTVTLVRKANNKDNLNPYEGKEELDSETITIQCKVTFEVKADTVTEGKTLTNVAWIAEEYDAASNTTITNQKKLDIDSEPSTKPDVNKDNMNDYIGNQEKNKDKKENLADGNQYFEGQQDDDDFEKLELKKFDLALRKWVTQAIVIDKNGQTITETGHKPFDDPEQVVKVELHRKKLKDVTVKFRYSIRVYNQGDVAGYVKEITDYVPEGLKFVAADNKGWKDEGNNVISTTLLENKLLQPKESADVEVVLTWINNENNLGVKVNTAEISKDDNEYDLPDIDSTPDNKKPGEDDIDDAPVALSIETGRAKLYTGITLTVLVILAGGITLIKKYVL